MEENEEEEDNFVYGIPVHSIDDHIQPLECIVLVKGINMEDGSPTMTTIGSSGITPWEMAGMLVLELERLKFATIYSSVGQNEEE